MVVAPTMKPVSCWWLGTWNQVNIWARMRVRVNITLLRAYMNRSHPVPVAESVHRHIVNGLHLLNTSKLILVVAKECAYNTEAFSSGPSDWSRPSGMI